ncbi:MAG: hypothetical protein ACRELB_23330 [Polyangiaceae bacterium]
MSNDAGAVLAPPPVTSFPREGSRMQTLIDPFELASRTLPQAPAMRAVAPAFPPPPARASATTTTEVQAVVDEGPPSRRPGTDSSGRLRCWCSD